jgi:hypothetical protein
VVLLADGDQPALIEFLWRAAPLLSLAHDVGLAGVDGALAEAADWSGGPADAGGEGSPGSVVLACARENVERLEWDVVEIGEVR